MAVVLTSQEESTYFAPSGLRRSHSQAKFSSRQAGAFHNSASASRIHDLYQPPVKLYADSNNSTAPSSPRTIQVSTADLSCSSTPASHLSLSTDGDACEETLGQDLTTDDDDEEEDDDDIVFPQYDNYHDSDTTHSPEELEPPSSPRADSTSGTGTDTSAPISDPDTPDFYAASDDTAVGIQPTRHVDYLSHNWREEDIWSSWKHIISNRDNFNNSSRLENASWRTWIKAKNNLPTISPETLNWFVKTVVMALDSAY